MPKAALKPMAKTTMSSRVVKGQPRRVAISRAASMPAVTPISPPDIESDTASTPRTA
jgi:hypothetical protein